MNQTEVTKEHKNKLLLWLEKQTNFGLILTDEKLNIIFCNQWIVDLIKDRCREGMGRNLLEVFPEIKERKYNFYYERALAGEPIKLSYLLHKYLILLPTRLPNPYFDKMVQSAEILPLMEGSTVIGTITKIDDVSERVVQENNLKDKIRQLRDTQKSLSESQKLYKNLVEASRDLIFSLDRQGRFTYLSPVLTEMTDYKQEEMLGKSFLDFQPPEANLNDLLQFEKILNGAPHVSYETVHIRKDGKRVHLAIKGVPLIDDAGNVIGAIGTASDITERKKIEADLHKYMIELENLNLTKDKFFSILSHDLKAPFNSLVGYTEILKEDFDNLNKEELMSIVNSINDNARNLLRLVENLLHWSLLQRNKIEIKPISLDVSEIVNDNIELFKGTADKKNIEIINQVEKGTMAFADQDAINSVFQNLITNAIKFTNSGGKITISAKTRDREIEVAVKDTGIGMTEDVKNRLFKIDQLRSKKGTADEKGTGLGLILTKDLITSNGGKIWVESELGKGTTVKFTIPKGSGTLE